MILDPAALALGCAAMFCLGGFTVGILLLLVGRLDGGPPA